MSATWGLHIPGYSSPSAAQQKLFKKMHPNEWADHVEQMHKEHSQRCEEYRRYQELAKKNGWKAAK